MNIYFGENLKELRRSKNLTQERLAGILGVSFQTVSKWERGETYPDITFLPEIASFFKISVDDLLGVNRAEKETEITEKLKVYDNLSDKQQKWELLKELTEQCPSDFRVTLRHMSYLVHFESSIEVLPKVTALYDNIQQNCTVDTIRISAKRHIAELYRALAEKNCSITFDDCEKIIAEMPKMRDGQEYLLSYLYPIKHPDYYANIQTAIEEETALLCSSLSHYYLYDDKFSADFKIDIMQKSIDFLEMLYDDGNYGRAWLNIMYDYGQLGYLYFEKGSIEKSISNFKKSIDLAKQFDNMGKITVMQSKLFEGRKFDKDILGSNFNAKSRIKHLLTERYPLSEDFKLSDEFQKIIKTLED